MPNDNANGQTAHARRIRIYIKIHRSGPIPRRPGAQITVDALVTACAHHQVQIRLFQSRAGSRLLNWLGLHVASMVLSDIMTRWRWLMLQHKLNAACRQAFQFDGFVVIEDFLPVDMCDALAREARGFNGPGIQLAQRVRPLAGSLTATAGRNVWVSASARAPVVRAA